MQPDLAERILQYVDQYETVDTLELASIFDENHQKIVGSVNSILAHGDLLKTEPASRKVWEVTAEGQLIIENGSHEANVFRSVPEDGISQTDLMKVIRKTWLLIL